MRKSSTPGDADEVVEFFASQPPGFSVEGESNRKHTGALTYEALVVDNGSHDRSPDYLRSASWIRLIDLGEETPANWLRAFATAPDYGIQEGRGRRVPDRRRRSRNSRQPIGRASRERVEGAFLE